MNRNFKSYPFGGKRVLVRVDFNVPFDKKTGIISDPSRIERSVPTIRHIAESGGRVILLSHLGRPGGEVNPRLSLRQVVPVVEALVGKHVTFVPEVTGTEVERVVADMRPGDIVLLENVRFLPEEEGKVKPIEGEDEDRFRERLTHMRSRQIALAKTFARYGNSYVNDAFGAAHRAHASTAYLAREFFRDKMFGLLMESEIEAMDRFLGAQDHPVTAILGGAKISDKLPLIENLLPKVDRILIGGGMAFTFIRAQGGRIGKSLCQEDFLEASLALQERARAAGVELVLPVDAVCGAEFKADTPTQTCSIGEIPEDSMGMDIGPASVELFRRHVKESRSILWNGPMGVFEFEAFSTGTFALAHELAEATQGGAYTLVGGGDSVAALRAARLLDKVSYVSTGGGAMLEYLEGKELPGIEAVRRDDEY